MLAPAGKSAGIFPASLGLVKALNDQGIKAVLFRPLGCAKNICPCNKSTTSLQQAVKLMASGQSSELYETIVANYQALVAAEQPAVVVVEGVVTAELAQDEVNATIAHALDSDLVFVNQGGCAHALAANKITAAAFGNAGKERVNGNNILNADAPKGDMGTRKQVLVGCGRSSSEDACECEKKAPKCVLDKVVATIAYNKENYAFRAKDLAAAIDGTVTAGCDCKRGYKIVACTVSANEGDILVTHKVPEATAASIVILTDGTEGTVEGATVITTKAPYVCTIAKLSALPPALPFDDDKRKEAAAACGAQAFCPDFVKSLGVVDPNHVQLMSPAAFRYKLAELARAAHTRVALPEGEEPRTVCAAAKVAEAGIAVPVLYGKKEQILKVAAEQGVTLGEGVEFVDPDEIRANYVDRLVELRKKKGVTPEQAVEMLKDNVFLATMMIERNEVDGLVSGAVHTTANTIRPPLQIIKTAPGAKLVSSVFFMLMPEQVYVYGDCAINPNPTSEDLSEIAIQSYDTAKTFGIDARVAMVTYSTGTSGKGPDVDLVTEATRIAKEKRPDMAIDGPLQYDAAVMPNVAAQKAPGSPVAGKANVFIFPSLACGNTCYKAVQRSANLVSIGPMLQGMRKPVNDLSRGALVDDIIYTIAITAIQATQS